MAREPLAELRSTIADQLERVWPQETDTPRFGIIAPAAPNALKDDVADEIAHHLHRDGKDTPDCAEPSTLPLGARIKPRGVFEDDWRARPTKRHPWPVILVHGTCDTKGIWYRLGAQLRADGWCVFAPDYGNRATGSIPESAQQLGAYIDTVLATTGAEQAIVVGHSQGGLITRYWMRTHGTADRIHHLVCLGSPNHGTTQGGIASPLVRTLRRESVMRSVIDGWFGPAGMQQVVGSELLEETNRDGDLEPGVTYTCIATHSDAIVVPPETCFLDDSGVPDGTVRNIYVQDFDRFAIVMHEDLPIDKRVVAIIRTVLEQIK
ncbi:lipase family alpha/beta hydrolase [Corynebacterium camporealensis]